MKRIYSLLIILTINYAIMLIFSVIVLSLIIKILKSVRNITSKVESGVEDISGTIDAVTDKIRPIITAGAVKFVMNMITKKKK